jgi:hypothetical protein
VTSQNATDLRRRDAVWPRHHTPGSDWLTWLPLALAAHRADTLT